MSAIYMSQLSTPLPLMEGGHHQDHHHQGHFQAFTLPKDPPILFPFVINSSSPSDSTLIYGGSDHLRQHQAIPEPQHLIGGGSSSVFAAPFPTVESIRDDMIERSSYDPYDIENLQVSSGSVRAGKWSTTAPAAAKMRITRKASDPGGAAAKKPRRRAAPAYEDHGHGVVSQQQQALGVIRVCSDCNTTKTPLWRSGPCGPKSLCNACGIRQRKARRAMMAGSATPTDGSKPVAAAAQTKAAKEKRADVDRSLPFKKRCKLVAVKADHTAAGGTAAAAGDDGKATAWPAAAPTRDLVDSIGVNWGRSPAQAAAVACSFRSSPAFAAQDEITDAAMLLMTLSCGLVRS